MFRGLINAIVGSNEDANILNDLEESLEKKTQEKERAKSQRKKELFEKTKKEIQNKVDKKKMSKIRLENIQKIEEVEASNEITSKERKDFIFTNSPQMSKRESI